MATCKDCVHYAVCVARTHENTLCDHFKNKSDVVPVVRCQDCQYSYWEKESETSSALKCGNPNGLFDEVDFNDFCSYGDKE